MEKRKSKFSLDYETLVKIKLAAQVLKEGFWMADLVDFLRANKIKIIGNPSNTSKWFIAKLSLETVNNKQQLNKIFKKILNNKNWHYSEPTESLRKLAETSNSKATNNIGRDNITLSFSNFHPLIQKVSRELFKDRYYSQAIFEAYKIVVNQVKQISGKIKLDGKALMEYVFSINNPVIKFNELQTLSEKDEQIGLMLLYCGATIGIRNPKAHDNIIQTDPIRTLEYLAFASLLLKRLDERIK